MTTLLASGAAGLVRADTDTGQKEVVLPGADVRSVATDPNDQNVVFAGTNGLGIFRSVDGGRSWGPSGLTWQIVKSVAASRAVPGLVLAGTKPAALFISTDRGDTWSELEGFNDAKKWWWRQPAERPTTSYVQSVALSPTDPDVMLAGIEASALLRSSDAGRSWSGHCDGAHRDCHSVTFNAADGGWAYEGAGALRRPGAAWSCDAGATWSRDDRGLDRRYGWAAAGDPQDPSRWFATLTQGPRAHRDGAAEGYVYRKRGDDPWERLTGGLPQPFSYFPYGLVTHPNYPGHVWVGVADGSVWQSSDNGDTWAELPVRFPSIHRSLVVI